MAFPFGRYVRTQNALKWYVAHVGNAVSICARHDLIWMIMFVRFPVVDSDSSKQALSQLRSIGLASHPEAKTSEALQYNISI